jgi:2'-5' RNA ligase
MTKQGNSYSLWLRPSQTQIDELMKIISRLSHRYRTTPFPPHITLLPSVASNINDLLEICAQITKQFPAFEIQLEGIAYTPAYFKNLFIFAKTEDPLIELYKQATKLLDYQPNGDYMPHVSLLYGNLDEKKQQALKKELTNSYTKVFSCQRLDLYNTTNHESQWHLIESFRFKS